MALRSLGRQWRAGVGIAAAIAAGGTVAYCEDPKTSVGFDPEGLERGAKALREINKSPYAKKVQHAVAAMCQATTLPSGLLLQRPKGRQVAVSSVLAF